MSIERSTVGRIDGLVMLLPAIAAVTMVLLLRAEVFDARSHAWIFTMGMICVHLAFPATAVALVLLVRGKIDVAYFALAALMGAGGWVIFVYKALARAFPGSVAGPL